MNGLDLLLRRRELRGAAEQLVLQARESLGQRLLLRFRRRHSGFVLEIKECFSALVNRARLSSVCRVRNSWALCPIEPNVLFRIASMSVATARCAARDSGHRTKSGSSAIWGRPRC